MRIYGIVLAAFAVLILGAKALQAGWIGAAPAAAEAVQTQASTNESEHDIMLRWQQNRANHWRGYVMQQP